MPLEERLTELIAVGASVTANCLGCVEFHVAKARGLGVGDEEIQHAIRIGKLVRRGAANKFDKFARGMLHGDRSAPANCSGECG